jgi:hypothetical protein
MGIGNFLVLNAGGLLELQVTGGLLLSDQTVKEPIVIIVTNEDVAADQIDEETTGLLTGELIDEDGAQVTLTEIDLIILTVQEPVGGTVLRHDESLNANGVTVVEGSLITTLNWQYTVQDTRMVDRTKSTERHRATFEFGHNSDSNGSVTDKITTILASPTVSIDITGHGLTAGTSGHHIFLNATDAVGGVTLRGAYRITSVVDTLTLEIDAHCDAAANAGPLGGVTTWWLNGKSNKHVTNLAVKRNDPVCP